MNEETQTTGQVAPDNSSDTADAQQSEASVQTQDTAPEATQTNEGNNGSEVNAEDTASEKLYAGKYKSVEEMEKAYTELQSKSTRDNQEKAELTRILNEAFSSPEPSPVQSQESYSEETNQQSDSEIESLKRDNAVVKFIVAHQDADGESMKQILASDPMVKQISSHEAKLEYAYLRSQSMSQPKAIEEAKKAAQTEAQAKTAEKQAAQVESARKAAPSSDQDSLMERATGNYPQEVRDQARRDLIKKHLVNL